MKAKVIFLEVKKNQEKLLKILSIAKYHLETKKKILFFVSDEKSEKFIDELLWKEPIFSFIPHSIDEKDIIVISQKKIKKAHYIFNLTQEPLEDIPLFGIYEFDDTMDKERMRISKKKFYFYKEKNLPIISK